MAVGLCVRGCGTVCTWLWDCVYVAVGLCVRGCGTVGMQEFVKLLKLQPGEHVLDVGAGIGGGDFYMAQVSLHYLPCCGSCHGANVAL